MRPPGEVRLALRAACVRLHAAQGAATYRELAAVAQVGYTAAHRCVENMARSGELVRVGHASRPGGGWIALYEPADDLLARQVASADASGAAGGCDRFAPLAFVLGQWPRTD